MGAVAQCHFPHRRLAPSGLRAAFPQRGKPKMIERPQPGCPTLTLERGPLTSRAMALREILVVPHPVLKQVSKPVDVVDDALRALMDDMLETMYEAPGIGLAA